MHEHPGLKQGIGQVVEQEVVGQDGRNAQKKGGSFVWGRITSERERCGKFLIPLPTSLLLCLCDMSWESWESKYP